MRDHNKAFVRAAAETFDCPGPILEFGSLQVEGQEEYADLRGLFPGKPYLGCDMRPGLGVDRVEDVTRMSFGDATAGTILCIETFEHVFEVRRAFDEVFRVLRPGGIFVITSPFNFRLHGYPDDYWRISPSCLRRMLEPYGGRLAGYQGHAKFPHTVMALAVKSPAPADFAARARRMADAYNAWLRQAEASLSIGEKARRAIGQVRRSRAERQQVAEYYRAAFTIDVADAPALAAVG